MENQRLLAAAEFAARKKKDRSQVTSTSSVYSDLPTIHEPGNRTYTQTHTDASYDSEVINDDDRGGNFVPDGARSTVQMSRDAAGGEGPGLYSSKSAPMLRQGSQLSNSSSGGNRSYQSAHAGPITPYSAQPPSPYSPAPVPVKKGVAPLSINSSHGSSSSISSNKRSTMKVPSPVPVTGAATGIPDGDSLGDSVSLNSRMSAEGKIAGRHRSR